MCENNANNDYNASHYKTLNGCVNMSGLLKVYSNVINKMNQSGESEDVGFWYVKQ